MGIRRKKKKSFFTQFIILNFRKDKIFLLINKLFHDIFQYKSTNPRKADTRYKILQVTACESFVLPVLRFKEKDPMHYDSDTIYIIGDAKAPLNNPITKHFNQYFIGLVVDRTSGKIVDVECSATIQLTVQFLKSIFVGKNIEDPVLIQEISQRYFGSSQKALIVAFQDAQKKYKRIVAALST
ncbi:hypothetical protein HMPREF1015_02297 [Bacillus smithii 7_3_47FAA]|uniref:DUF3870 domain-containing protein n=2 Tax=Bacillus smithii TaxID=1479 RepID=G9QIK6_9BACI|nr:hypothetical protein HMPREF1015_02297 [Bacillus smithii 7_3_47FAA]